MQLLRCTMNKNQVKFLHTVSDNWSMEQSHFHDYYEVNLSVSGGNNFFCNDTLHYAKKGDLFLFNDQDLHKNMVKQGMNYERYLVFFHKDIITDMNITDVDLLKLFDEDRANFKNKITLTKDQYLHIIQFLNDTIYSIKNAFFGRDALSRTKLIELLIMIHTYYYQNQGNTSLFEKHNNKTSDKTDAIITYINTHINEPLSLDILANHIYLNKFYMAELFKKETGFTINQYIISKRILLAQTLLKQGLSVTETTFKVGYENQAHFIRTFKKHVGITPKQYGLGRQ